MGPSGPQAPARLEHPGTAVAPCYPRLARYADRLLIRVRAPSRTARAWADDPRRVVTEPVAPVTRGCIVSVPPRIIANSAPSCGRTPRSCRVALLPGFVAGKCRPGGPTCELVIGLVVGVVVLLSAGSAPGQFGAKDPGPRWSDTPAPGRPGDPIPGLTTNPEAALRSRQGRLRRGRRSSPTASARASTSTAARAVTSSPPSAAAAPRSIRRSHVAKAFGAHNTCRRSSSSTGRCAKRASATSPMARATAAFTRSSSSAAGSTAPTATRSGCTIRQEDFESEVAQQQHRLPHPDAHLRPRARRADPRLRDQRQRPRRLRAKTSLGIGGRAHRLLPTGNPNRNGNDGTIARFGWKAQNKSLLLFSGEAYNVEMGITNELFQSERDETPNCQFAPTPNDITNTDAQTPAGGAERHREVRRLHALPGAAHAVDDRPGNPGLDRSRPRRCSSPPAAPSVTRRAS